MDFGYGNDTLGLWVVVIFVTFAALLFWFVVLRCVVGLRVGIYLPLCLKNDEGLV